MRTKYLSEGATNSRCKKTASARIGRHALLIAARKHTLLRRLVKAVAGGVLRRHIATEIGIGRLCRCSRSRRGGRLSLGLYGCLCRRSGLFLAHPTIVQHMVPIAVGAAGGQQG